MLGCAQAQYIDFEQAVILFKNKEFTAVQVPTPSIIGQHLVRRREIGQSKEPIGGGGGITHQPIGRQRVNWTMDRRLLSTIGYRAHWSGWIGLVKFTKAILVNRIDLGHCRLLKTKKLKEFKMFTTMPLLG